MRHRLWDKMREAVTSISLVCSLAASHTDALPTPLPCRLLAVMRQGACKTPSAQHPQGADPVLAWTRTIMAPARP
jgi:hypothetical protein